MWTSYSSHILQEIPLSNDSNNSAVSVHHGEMESSGDPLKGPMHKVFISATYPELWWRGLRQVRVV